MSVGASLVLGVRCEDLSDGLEQGLLVAGDGARQVEAEAPAQPPRWSRVVLSPALQCYLVLALPSNCGNTR